MEEKCQFIEECFAANIHCDAYLENTCYQAELMKIKLKQAQSLPCPITTGLKCDRSRERALLPDVEQCTINGKCKPRIALPDAPAHRFDDASNLSHKIKLSGMEIMRELNRLSA